MSRYYSYINTSVDILRQYDGGEPFASFLKKFFSKQKKYGSRDRRQIGQLCYAWFRLGHALREMPETARLLTAYFLSVTTPDALLTELKPEWASHVDASLAVKITLTGTALHPADIFPWRERWSDGLDEETFPASHLVQPDLFLRIRPGRKKLVEQLLSNAGLSYTAIHEDCLALPNSSALQDLLKINRDVVIQDRSSQEIGHWLRGIGVFRPRQVWDCCAASGGKSILLHDYFPNIELTVSDIRTSILHNLRERFREAGIKEYGDFVADLTNPSANLPAQQFDCVVADVPCTGSGTWGRTPEQLYYFKPELIDAYAVRQQQILERIMPSVKKGGFLLYITCSVFRRENEEKLAFMNAQPGWEYVDSRLFSGYTHKADTLFGALFRKL
ncbi:MAG: hypothetical protein ABS85_12940 [Sphingobacteriales bacterium SCN 48-20]|uniref:Fmu (Sun) domain-containing protein n=1 Tax=Terrimonas ferruginea TaxID=249 RepID=UPI0008691728|nr:Fmu (Sun) domain-containing protein [Terrimonas ferruginea]MBN8784022.1 Fmu (Sun) domain-containing protein [Terrimonas ferruginea]ODT91345.1 MAG: hypothetical protein ABS85_12940 [Sphingobacteriales bacterium SCN 48-20]OJW41673.1 MAG: hypothetical protein BGO56_17610 [Sphingobacteriales bacterium 48-107]